ncbi:MAG: hypothetical protein E6Q75_02460 [Rheinheimera sp.]|nr:MAG: hypothetical protein E6Q75_02460 [Rheinheimera sp.]
MLKYAVLDATYKVIGVSTLSGPVELENHILLSPESEIQAGDLYDRVSAEFSRPEPLPVQPIQFDLGWCITTSAFRQRFTFAERVDLKTKANTNIALAVLIEDLSDATYADLTLAEYAEAMGLLVYTGVLTVERVAAIMTTPPAWHELPLHIQNRLLNQGYQIDV